MNKYSTLIPAWGQSGFHAILCNLEKEKIKEENFDIEGLSFNILTFSRLSNLDFIAKLKIEKKLFIAIVEFDKMQIISLD